ncbi:MAG: hypothetical protein U0175_34835 [Caldilineaceae bacterium]
MSEPEKENKTKKSKQCATPRAVQRDRSKRLSSELPDEQVVERLHAIVHPATLAQIAVYEALGLRARI